MAALSSAVVALLLACLSAVAQAQAPQIFHNPLLPSGPDPWVVEDGGYYYLTVTTGSNLTIRRTRNLADAAHAEARIVWTPPAAGPYSKQIWAPELHRLDGHWYLYFAADDGSNENHRIYALENASANPLEGAWTFKGKVADATDRWAIDASVFRDAGTLYMIWSGWEGATDGEQRLYIAHMSNPWTIDSSRVEISRPTQPWERVGDLPGRHVNVNEGPEILRHGDRLFLIYSASGCWTDSYELGMLTARSGSDLLKAASWTKAAKPVFTGSAEAGVYAPGHNGFFQSNDGRENWIVYHANSAPHLGCGRMRSPRIQRFTWKPDGTPDFGTPVPETQPIPAPVIP